MARLIEQTVHESPAIADTVCNGCLRLEVLTEKRRYGDREKYWCGGKRGYVKPHDVDACDMRADSVTDVFDASTPANFNRDGKL